MGKAIIVENRGSALYRATLVYDLDALRAEKTQLEVLNDDYWRLLNNALNHRNLLRQDVAMYRETLNAIIQQWKDSVMDNTKVPPPIVPEEAEDEKNPATGQPYTDEERETSLEAEVLTKINAVRTASGLDPFVRSETLHLQVRNRLKDWQGAPVETLPDLTSDAYLQMLLRQQSIQEEGRTVREAILDQAPGVIARRIINAAASGQTTSDAVIAALQNDPDTWAELMDENATEAGARYRYNPGYPGTHNWGVSTLTPGTTPAGNPAFFAAPAGQALVAAMESALGPVIAAGLKEGADGGSGGGGSGSGSWNEAWSANTQYGAGTTVMGRRASGTQCLCRSLQSGLSGDSEPLWPSPGGSTGDYQMIWTVLSDIPDSTGILINDWYGYPY